MAIVYYYSIQQTSLLLVYYYYQCTIIVYYYQCIITIIVYYYYLANIITITHMIHVWYICLHWGYIDGIHVTIQQHHGSYGLYFAYFLTSSLAPSCLRFRGFMKPQKLGAGTRVFRTGDPVWSSLPGRPGSLQVGEGKWRTTPHII